MATLAAAAVAASRGSDSAPRVRAFSSADAQAWDRFVDRCEQATFFHRSGWREILEKVAGHRCHYLLAERDGAICGVLPLAEVRSRVFGHALASLPFCVYGGPAATDPLTEQALTEAAARLARSLRVEHLELRNLVVKRPDWPRQELYVTFRKALAPDVDANLLAIPRKQRAMVRKGMARGLASDIDANADRFFELYADNMHRHGTPALPKGYFTALQRVFQEACEILTITDSAGKPVSAVLSFYFRDEVMPYYAGDTVRSRELAANDFKYWELMRRACERGLRWFDYGRSKRGSGSFDFKKNWGFTAAPLAYEYLLLGRHDIPQNNPMNPRYRAMIAAWRRLPRPLVDAIGPYIARNVG
jgi:FemAB-related protein (PEP-CTERM system-associated)